MNVNTQRIKPPSTCPAIRAAMMPRDTNAANTIFGGVLLSYIDQAGFVEARRQSAQRYVTVAMHEIKFLEPVFVGDIVSFNCQTTKIGRTSITVRVTVVADRFEDAGTTIKVTDAEVIFVAVDEHGRPKPIFDD